MKVICGNAHKCTHFNGCFSHHNKPHERGFSCRVSCKVHHSAKKSRKCVPIKSKRGLKVRLALALKNSD